MSFTPFRLPISGITNANPAVVTTSIPHNLTTGQVVRINVPKNYGMSQLDHVIAIITVISSNTFSLQYTQVTPGQNIDSRTYGTFSIPSNPQFTAEAIPIGCGPTPVTKPVPLVTNGVLVSNVDDAYTNTSTSEIPF